MSWTLNDIPDMKDKISVVTGANSGIGYYTAFELAKKGSKVFLACRNQSKAEAAIAQMKLIEPKLDLNFIQLDTSDLQSVRQCADELHKLVKQVDVLVNNAGIGDQKERKESKDGFEITMATNHFGHFALTGLILDLIEKSTSGRIVNVSSIMHSSVKSKFTEKSLAFDNGKYDFKRAYGCSKLANLLFGLALQSKLDQSGSKIVVVGCHPGFALTNIFFGSGNDSWLAHFLAKLASWFGQSDQMGALPSIYAATCPEVVKNGYYGPDGWFEIKGNPIKLKSSELANDLEFANELWDISAKMTKITYKFNK